MATKRTRFFVRDESGDPAMYCGDTPAEAVIAMANLLKPQLESLAAGGGETLTFEVQCDRMTDAEIRALPEV